MSAWSRGFLNTKENSGGGKLYPPYVLGNYATDHSEIRYAYGSDHSDGLPIGSRTKYPEFPEKFRNFPESPEFSKFPEVYWWILTYYPSLGPTRVNSTPCYSDHDNVTI